ARHHRGAHEARGPQAPRDRRRDRAARAAARLAAVRARRWDLTASFFSRSGRGPVLQTVDVTGSPYAKPPVRKTYGTGRHRWRGVESVGEAGGGASLAGGDRSGAPATGHAVGPDETLSQSCAGFDAKIFPSAAGSSN